MNHPTALVDVPTRSRRTRASVRSVPRAGRTRVTSGRTRSAYLLSAPAMLLVAALVVVPSIQAIYYSFTNWDGVEASWVGLENFVSGIFLGPGSAQILLNNLAFIVSVPIAVAVQFCIAYLLHTGVRGSSVMRILLFLPITVSWAAVGLAFRYLVLEYQPAWLADPTLSLVVVIAAFVWTSSGANILIMFAGLSTLEPSQIEAAKLDGAGPLRILVSVVAPNLIAFIDFALITTLITSLTGIFGLIYTFNFGGPGYASTTLEFHLYQGGFASASFGLAAATGVTLMIITIAVSVARIIPTIRRIGS